MVIVKMRTNECSGIGRVGWLMDMKKCSSGSRKGDDDYFQHHEHWSDHMCCWHLDQSTR